MIIEQLIKKLNNTELGKTATHETYVQVPNDLDVSSIFEEAEHKISFYDKDTQKEYDARLTIGREHRICGLGKYYRDKELSAGDEVIFEKRTVNGRTDYFISARKLQSTIVLRKSDSGYELLTPERMELLTEDIREHGSGLNLRIEFDQSKKKRSDSPVETEYYKVYIGDKELNNSFFNGDMIEIEIIDKIAVIRSDFIWKNIHFEQEDE